MFTVANCSALSAVNIVIRHQQGFTDNSALAALAGLLSGLSFILGKSFATSCLVTINWICEHKNGMGTRPGAVHNL